MHVDPDRKFHDLDGNEVPMSGGPRIKVPESVGRAIMAATPEERTAILNQVIATRRLQERKAKQAKAVAAKRTAQRKAARKARRKGLQARR